jgi:hypothetical protein
MPRFATCGACERHVRGHERACPFCGAAVAPKALAAAAPAWRASRAEWLARGSALALAGCSSSMAGGTPTGADATAVEAGSATPDAAPSADADAAAILDGTTQAPGSALCEAGRIGAVPGRGAFECAAAGASTDVLLDGGYGRSVALDAALFCDRATEYCDDQGGSYSCRALVELECNLPLAWCDSGVLSCPCAAPWGGYSCTDDDAGGLTVQGPCYGAPPARLERRAPSVAGVA